MDEKNINGDPEAVSIVITPPEFSELYKRLDAVEERVGFVLGEISQKEGVKLGGHLGFIYGFMMGLTICILLKFTFHLI